MLLASISIPYSTMTCLISNETNLSLMVQQENCSPGEDKFKSSIPSLQKDACCLFSNGLIESDVELIHSNLQTLTAYIAPKEFALVHNLAVFNIEQTLNLDQSLERPPDIPIRILLQSFLC
jgi:hypothetical protein